ncbi:MAG: tRNA lysidine(34) synthetase TilS, partial [Phycisphaerae bacterium]|nr:tRNA lysidine(34) synthetase TilS [Phycisphaerae bacterium]
MALLHGLAAANQAFNMGLRLHVAHLNHRTRGADSDADAEFVAAQSATLGLPCTIETVDVPAQLGPAGGGLERAGRTARYDFFARLARQQDCRLVATGHHADDNAETILQRIIRGTGPRGLAGIPRVRTLSADAALNDGRAIQLIRPLLSFRRRLIERFLAVNGIPFRKDASNLAPEPMRNWLRHELIPLLGERGNPGVVAALLRLGELSGWVNTFIEETARRTLSSLIVDRTDVELSLNAASLSGKGRILQAELIRQAIMSLGPREAEIGLRHLKAVMRLAEQEESGKRVSLPGEMIAQRHGGQVVLRRSVGAGEATFAVAPDEGAAVTVQLPGVTPLPRRRRQLVIELLDNRPDLLETFKAARSAGEELIDADRLRPPLVIRPRRPGDRFWPLGASGTKKVGDFLSDRKVPAADRESVFLLCDQLGPVWVIPFRIDDRVRMTEVSRKLAKLKFETI